ncbi:MAG: single-stranded-DNA-specific exonuclease RecJ [Roseburia sp.]|nr:single-stranded-DNA-specific exonuclease RecJ [Roseburia sp.]
MEKWFVAAKRADFHKWAEEFGISPILARIIRNRDITEEEQVRKFLNGTLADCYSPWLLYDMDRAVKLLLEAVDRGTFIRVIGDYDVDGICSSYILTRGLGLLGAKVDTAIPHRIHDGYGLNDHLIQEAYEEGVGMIVTCDNGIAAAPQIELAAKLGIQVIITDHHEVPFVMKDGERQELLPPALAVVNPKQEKDCYPFPNICGGVVAYKLMAALQERAAGSALEGALEEFLAFAAFATVCDVMELRDENRIIVKEGLKRLRTIENQGLLALIEVNGLEKDKLSAYHLGFVLGPCLNATGRLDTAKRALELLQSTTRTEAMTAAAELKALNDSRKNLTLQGVELAEQLILAEHRERDKVLVIYLPQVHESLAGIIAGRIREKYNRPVFLLTRGEEDVKGSGRSVPAYHMFEAMTEVKQYFTRFGGHRLAAGLSMKEEDIPALCRALNDNCRLTEEDFIPQVHIDVPMPLYAGDQGLALELEKLEPFGVGNPRPLFAQKGLIFKAGYRMGKNKTAARFSVLTPEGENRQLVFFGDLERFGAFLREKYGEDSEGALYSGRGHFDISVVYQLGLNTYKGCREVQYIMQYYC